MSGWQTSLDAKLDAEITEHLAPGRWVEPHPDPTRPGHPDPGTPAADPTPGTPTPIPVAPSYQALAQQLPDQQPVISTVIHSGAGRYDGI